MKINIMTAMTKERGIGKGEILPWNMSKYLRQCFKHITIGEGNNAIVMGRKTFFSFPKRPLPERLNIVLSRTMKGEYYYPSLEAGLLECHEKKVDNVFIIGGEEIYKQTLFIADKLYITYICRDIECDRFFPKFNNHFLYTRQNLPKDFDCKSNDREDDIEFAEYRRVNHEENSYLDNLEYILENGNIKRDRTSIGTRSIFGGFERYNLRHNQIPILTTKRVFIRGIIEELLWFLRGSTNANELLDRGIKIWMNNSSRRYMDHLGFTEREEGDIGPGYGFQWRHAGAEYVDCRTDYKDKGCDQIAECIRLIKRGGTSRRMIVCSWNANDLKNMNLPPCHCLFQFYVDGDELSCMMYQRSADMGLGVPFNIASYSILTRIIARECGLKPGEFIHCTGDTHVYLNHEDAVRLQINRTPNTFPLLYIDDNIEMCDLEYKHFKILGYNPETSIKMDMAI